MHMPMNELALSKDKRCEARRIRLVDRDDPHFRQISKARVVNAKGVQKSIGMPLDSNNSSKNYIALADCDEFLSTGLCFYDEGEAACFTPSWFVILKPMDIERWKCAALLLNETLSSGTCADYDGLLERYEPDWLPLYERRADLGITVCVMFVCVECMYGGLHALAWNVDFRTVHEKHLWRIAVVFIVACGPAAMLIFVVSKTRWKAKEFELDAMKSTKRSSMQRSKDALLIKPWFRKIIYAMCGLWGLIFGLFFFLEVMARMFLMVECFIALFHSVPGVFEEPSWSAYVPHIN